MADIFGYKRNPKPEGVFSTEDSMLTFGSLTGNDAVLGYLVQNWNINYQQQVNEIFEIGSNALYWTKGRPVGDGTLARIMGEKGESGGRSFFPDEAYDICDGGAGVDITAMSGHCEEFNVHRLSVHIDGVVVTGIGFSMQVQDVMLQEQIRFRFAQMEINS